MGSSQLDDIIDSMFEIGRYMRTCMLELAKDGPKLNLLQIHALLLLQKQPGISLSELALHLKVTSPSASVFVQRLVKLRWVRRDHSRTNRKLIRLRLTPSGEKMLKTMDDKRKTAQRNMLSVLPASDQNQLARILAKVASTLPNSLPSSR